MVLNTCSTWEFGQGFSESLVTPVSDPRTCDQNLKGGLCSRMEPSTYRFWITSADLVSGFRVKWVDSWMPSECGGTGCCWHRPHIFGERDNTQSYSFPLFVSGGELRDRGLYYVEQSTQNPSVVFCIFRIPSRIRDLIKWVVTDCVLSSSYHLHALHPGTFPPTTFSWEQGHHVSRDFSKDY